MAGSDGGVLVDDLSVYLSGPFNVYGPSIPVNLWVTIPEVQRYHSYEKPDEMPNQGTQFGSWLPHVM